MEMRMTFTMEKNFAVSWNASAHVGAHPLKRLPVLAGGAIVYPVAPIAVFPATVAAFYAMSPQDAADLLAFYGLPAVPAAGRRDGSTLPLRRAAIAAHIGLILN